MIKLKDILSEAPEAKIFEAKTATVSQLKKGQKFTLDQEPGILSGNRSWYKLSPKKFGDAVFQVIKLNKKSVDAIVIKGAGKPPGMDLPWSSRPSDNSSRPTFVRKDGKEPEWDRGYYEYFPGGKLAKDEYEKGRAFLWFRFTTSPTMKGPGDIPVILK